MTTIRHRLTLSSLAFGAALLSASLAWAQTTPAPFEVRDAWIRPAVAGQSGTGGFMNITAQTDGRLTGVQTPAAGIAEVHEMKMDGDTMRMRALPDGLALPAHQTVALKPGGYHLMLMDLKQPMKAGSQVPVTLSFEDAKGVKSQLLLQVPVGMPAGAAAAAHGHGAKAGDAKHKH